MSIPTQFCLISGASIETANAALIMLHGRGGNAKGITSLADELNTDGMALYAPEAPENSWYPYSFMAPDINNFAALENSLMIIDQLVGNIIANGIPANNLYFLGFSQGACLALEYIARNARRYGGAVALTGGLIGEHLVPSRYEGNFDKTPILITTGDSDPHVPLSRVEESVDILDNLNSHMALEIYPGRQHTILKEELALANQFIFTGKNDSSKN
jgi:phospholipase/carboxylesterase